MQQCVQWHIFRCILAVEFYAVIGLSELHFKKAYFLSTQVKLDFHQKVKFPFVEAITLNIYLIVLKMAVYCLRIRTNITFKWFNLKRFDPSFKCDFFKFSIPKWRSKPTFNNNSTWIILTYLQFAIRNSHIYRIHSVPRNDIVQKSVWCFSCTHDRYT